MNGFINLLKPPGMTSSDAVMFIKKRLPRKTAVGHGGTLDPDAAGVLPICVGKATRLFDYIIDKDKTYIGELTLGITTDTDDISGRVLDKHEVNVSEGALKTALSEFVGEIMQVPPMYSALKKGGEPLYKLARKGETLELDARKVRIERIELLDKTAENRYLLKITCGKGVYIRSLMRDIGEKLGTGGCMSFLLRSESGAMSVKDGVTLDEIVDAGEIEKFLLPMDYMLGRYPYVKISAQWRENVLNGQVILPSRINETDAAIGDTARLYVGGEFAGMGIVSSDGMKINAMLLER